VKGKIIWIKKRDWFDGEAVDVEPIFWELEVSDPYDTNYYDKFVMFPVEEEDE
jgi:hypothetical protein